MNYESSNIEKRNADIETSIVYMILLSIAFIAVSYILSFQAGMPSYWARFALYSRVITLFLDSIFLLLYNTRHNWKIDIPSFKLSICLIYVAGVAILVYASSILKLFADGFTWPATYLVFFLYFKEHEYPPKLKHIVIVCHLICCLFLIRTILTLHLLGTNPGPVYHALVFLPFLLLIGNKREKIVHSIFVVILLFLTAKRTGLIALILGFASYFIISIRNQDSLKKKWRSIIGIALLALLLIGFTSYYSEQTNYIILRLNNITEDQGSGRFREWNSIIELVKSSPLVNQIIGHGFQAVPTHVHPYGKAIFAHNSYIEFLYDLGIIGLAIITSVAVNMIWKSFRLIKEKSAFAPTAAFATIIVLTFSLSSYCFEESNYIMMISAYWGMMRGLTLRRKVANFNIH